MHGNSEPIPELGNRTWEELEVIDGESGHVLFKDQIRQRKGKGWEAIEIRVRVTRPEDSLLARRDARLWFQQVKLDPAQDPDMFEEIEQVCLLARAIRTAKAPHAQLVSHEDLAREFDEGSLQDVLGRINVYKRLLDPRDSGLSEEEIYQKVLAISKRGHLGPLADIAGYEQPSFLVRMAEEALRSPRLQSWLQSLETSIPEGSLPNS